MAQGGLLDFLESPAAQGLLGAAFGALGSRGTPVQAIGQGGLLGLNAWQGAKDREQQAAWNQARIAEKGAEQQEMQRRWKFVESLMNPGGASGAALHPGPPQPAQAGVGPAGSAGPLSAGPGAPSLPGDRAQGGEGGPAPLAMNLPPMAVAADMILNGGKNVGEWMYKRGTPDMQVSNGYAYDRNKLPPGYLPQLNMSQNGQASMVQIGADGMPRVTAPQGAVETFGQFRDADERAKASYDPVKVYNPASGREEYVPRAMVAAGVTPPPRTGPTQPMPQPPGQMPRPREIVPAQSAMPDSVRIIQREYENEPDPVNRAALKRELDRIDPGGRYRQQLQRQPAQPQTFAAGPSAQERNATQAQGDINQNWLKSSYEPALSAGDTANSLLANVQSARMALRGLGTTGYGAQTRVAVAGVLAALGVPQADKVAANGELFQQAASSRLFDVLGAQKGPQTEGDAARASKTFASISNRMIANQYLLDLMQATAERDQMRASFYRDALPLAQREGDLAKVDREWQKVVPSIFSLPVMKRWTQGVK